LQHRGSLARAVEARAALVAAAVLAVLAAGSASALVLERAAAPPLAPAAVPAVAVEPRVLAESDLTLTAAWQVPATTLDLVLPEAAPEPAAVPAPAAAAVPAAVPADPLCSGPGWEQRRGEAALAELRRPSDASSFRVSFEPAREGLLGQARMHERRLQVFVRSCDAMPSSLLRHVLAHELGHLVDADRLSDDLRARWTQARGIAADTPWYGCDSCVDFATPAGDFAEVYAQWQTGAGSNRSQLAPAPSGAALADLAARFF
jgi:hypothetical protein